MATLWAWATPAPYEHSPVDHTWVTDYDNRVDEPPQNVAEVIAAAGNYWFCWGAFHARGESREVSQGFLGSMPRSIALANCLARSNAPSASDKPTCGTIRLYGIEGVCHQLANQVLWATASATHPPLTVGSARGYGASIFFYGTYGLQHHAWTSRKTSCGKAPTTPPNGSASTTMSGSPSPTDDEFAEKAATVLAKGAADNKLPALLALRRQAQEKLLGTQRETINSANALNEMHRFFLTRAATLLNDAEFADIFSVAKTDIPNVELVDPGNSDDKQSRK